MFLKLRTSSNQKIGVSSDLHLGHNRDFIFSKRGYASLEDHSEGVINILNEMFSENDILILLGDFCLNTTEEKFEEYLSKIKCQNIYTLWGNHPNPMRKIYNREVFSKYGENVEVYPFRYKNLIFMGDYVEATINGYSCILCHYPISVWNHMQHGSFMLCGHSHNSFPESRKTEANSKILDCGWDGHGKPYIFNEIVELFKNRINKKVDHHA